MLEYRIVEKAQFTVTGVARRFNTETSYNEIPRFWNEHMNSDMSKVICGMFGICLDMDGNDFDYLIADNYIPWQEVPEGCVTRVIPAATWAVFPCTLKTLQAINTRIFSEWLPASKSYRPAHTMSVEMYGPPAQNPEDTPCEIWVPVEKV